MEQSPVRIMFASGHRPFKGCYDISHHTRQKIREHCLIAIKQAYLNGFNTFISGLAQGFDQDFALCVIQLRVELQGGVYLIGAKPYKDQGDNWHKKERRIYERIVEQCDSIVTVSEKYTPECYQLRNEFMVDQSDGGIALWNGTPGGTRNTIRYALQNNKRVQNLLTFDVQKALED